MSYTDETAFKAAQCLLRILDAQDELAAETGTFVPDTMEVNRAVLRGLASQIVGALNENGRAPGIRLVRSVAIDPIGPVLATGRGSCKFCDGTGYDPFADDDRCDRCGGAGKVTS